VTSAGQLSLSLLRSGLELSGVESPGEETLRLPERAIQFGTGAFLRGFVEYFIDAANRSGSFNGRVVAVASTSSARNKLVNQQDGLFTLVVEGMRDGKPTREFRIVSSLSRALSAASEWEDVVALARDPRIEIVFSNTTEVGITLDEPESPDFPPRSFPGKLTMWLLERARATDFASDNPVTVIPCELVEQNGDRLREVVLILAERWGPGNEFIKWITSNVVFCNTLVDRIVPGKPGADKVKEMETQLGYRDELLTVCEPYRLFAIEAPARVRDRLTFTRGDDCVVLTDDVEPFRLRKVRLLNGSHSLLAPVGLLCGLSTVGESVEDPDVGNYLRRAMFDEILPVCDAPEAAAFASNVLERFANPYIAHSLIDITLHATAKMRVRVIPTIMDYSRQEGRVPDLTCFGFAAFLLLRSRDESAATKLPADESAAVIRDAWLSAGASADNVTEFVKAICEERSLWQMDLCDVRGFVEVVSAHLSSMLREGVRPSLRSLIARTPAAPAVSEAS
jgi:tagaturonate reductase